MGERTHTRKSQQTLVFRLSHHLRSPLVAPTRNKVARDLIEEGRCGRAHEIAASFGIKVSDTDPFWKDRTFLELNYAVREFRS